jgi:hypothetical protein
MDLKEIRFMGVHCIQLRQILCPLGGDYMKIAIFRDVTLCSSVQVPTFS